MRLLIASLIACAALTSSALSRPCTHLVPVDTAYSATSVNTAIFRNSSVVTHNNRQYVSYYDPDGYLTIAARDIDSDEWQIERSPYKGNVADAHNVISMAVDGEGWLHVAFDHHGHPLKYCRSVAPGSLKLGKLQPMTGDREDDVTYPEFYTLKGGDLLFAYRQGYSGRGNLVLNRYDLATGSWHRIHNVLIDGEDQRNAYWQLAVDTAGDIHLSWVWRETWLVETNHDLCYARSRDNGVTWERSDGTPYTLPITMDNAEVVWHIPQNSELINQTSMAADPEGNPYIATYWRDSTSTVPQYRLVWHDGDRWNMSQVGDRVTPFTLSGGGTKMIPVARPRMVTRGNEVYYIFRDEERDSRVSIAYRSDTSSPWEIHDVTPFSVGAWEPSLDTRLWNDRGILHIYVQESGQGDGEKVSSLPPRPVYILEVDMQSSTRE